MKYLIELVADPKGIEPAITAMDELNAKEKELKATTATVSTEQKKMLDAYAEKAKLGKASVDKLMDGYKQLGKAATGAFGNEAIKGATKAAESFRSQLRGSREEITKLFVSGKATTAQIYEMSKGAGELKDSIGDAQQAISVLSSDTFATDAILGGLQGVAGGVQAVVGASVLFTDVQAVAAEVTAKLNALMAISNGIKEVQIALQEVSAARLGAEILAQKAYALVVGQSTGAMAAFRIVLATLTGGIILAGIIALVMNFDKLKEAVGGYSSSMQKSLDIKQKQLDLYDEMDAAHDNEIKKLELEGASQEQLIKLSQLYIKQKIDETKKVVELAGIQLQKTADSYAKGLAIANGIPGGALFAKIFFAGEGDIEKAIQQNKDLSARLLKLESESLDLDLQLKQIYDKKQLQTDKGAKEKLLAAQRLAIEEEIALLEIQRIEFKDNRKELLRIDEDLIFRRAELAKIGEKSIIKISLIDAQAIADANALHEKYKKDEEDRIQKMLKAKKDASDRGIAYLKEEQAKKQKILDEELKAFKVNLEKRLAMQAEIERRKKINAQKAVQEQKEREEAIKETSIQIAQQTADAIFQIVNTNRNNEFNAQIQNLQTLKDRELSNKELSEAQKARIEERYQRKIAEIKTKQAIADRNAALAQAVINGALAITKTIAQLGFPAAIPAVIAVAAQTAIQLAVIGATKIPKFAKGTEFVQGGGTETSDSVPAMLSRGERVIDAKTNKLLKGIPNKMLPQLLIPDIASTVNGSNFDYNKMAKVFSKELANNPALMVNFDKSGFNTFIKQGVTVSQIKNNRNGV